MAYSIVFLDVEKKGHHDEIYGAFCEHGTDLGGVTWIGGVVEDELHRFCFWHLGKIIINELFEIE